MGSRVSGHGFARRVSCASSRRQRGKLKPLAQLAPSAVRRLLWSFLAAWSVPPKVSGQHRSAKADHGQSSRQGAILNSLFPPIRTAFALLEIIPEAMLCSTGNRPGAWSTLSRRTERVTMRSSKPLPTEGKHEPLPSNGLVRGRPTLGSLAMAAFTRPRLWPQLLSTPGFDRVRPFDILRPYHCQGRRVLDLHPMR